MTTSSFAGTVQSGGSGTAIPQRDMTVTLYEATTGAPTTLGSATTDAAGRFSIPITGTGGGILYATAVRGSAVLVTVVGAEIPGEVVINELTTVAAAFSMAQFTDGATIAG